VAESPAIDLAAIRERIAKVTPGPWHLLTDSCDCGNGYGCSHGEFPYAIVLPQHTVSNSDQACDPNDPQDDYWHTASEISDLTMETAEFVAHARQDIADLLAEIDRIRAAAVDPQLLRWCDWPVGCLASYDASTGPTGGGWKHIRGGAVLLCPDHSPTVHWPRYEINPDDRTYLVAHCGCGESAEVRPSNWDAVQAWWNTHVKEDHRG
jgi:hypothetical protein